jgi:hypothetical protein
VLHLLGVFDSFLSLFDSFLSLLNGFQITVACLIEQCFGLIKFTRL